ncbi:hypothetical protein [Actibacterium sp. XHP0104]|nr:hypothetical protein [Actibacterium sp. XHP0104]MCV2881134.1 hypothetical protein [Actibacterium sp. XHP0104]
MHTIAEGYRGLSVLVNLNWDRIFYMAAIGGALTGGAFVGSLL